ncbi:MAG TPA: Mpo1-like protein [Candidatus Elarobacter sp.]|nr:Mpo1-like protein [Candidatus Elarobacter sp.]
MASESTLFEEYGAYHRDRRNLICHEIGIPLIVLAIVAPLRLVVVPWWGGTLAALAVGLTVLYYVVAFGRTQLTAVVIAAVGLTAIYYVAAYVTWPWALAAFVVGWVFQFVGHAYEGKSPAFLTNLLHLLVGPLWVASHLVPRSASSSSAR